MRHTLRSLAVCIAAALLGQAALAQRSPTLRPKPLPQDITPKVQVGQCGALSGFFGPLDFRGIHPEDRRVVEAYHLDMEMATFLSGRVVGVNRAGTGPVTGGFVYVVRSIPNHPVAMMLLEQVGRKLKTELPQNIDWPLECMYVRAFQLVPDDPVVWGLYGIYLAHRGRDSEAVYQLDRAHDPLRGNGPLQYQMGLANLAIKRYRQAQINALTAEARGFKLPGLREQLKAAGKWNEQLTLPPEPEVPASAVPAASAASAAGG